jgi:hypothetical protein
VSARRDYTMTQIIYQDNGKKVVMYEAENASRDAAVKLFLIEYGMTTAPLPIIEKFLSRFIVVTRDERGKYREHPRILSWFEP